MYKIVRLDAVPSTNTYARTLDNDPDHRPLVVITDNQTAGRGQRGNTWESEPGKNLTFTLVLYPTYINAAHQFELSMLVSLGIVNALRTYVPAPGQLKIKWPNDIYYADSKLCGILIENTIHEGRLQRTLAGIGININQTTFRSDAPNPISLKQIAGHDLDPDQVLHRTVDAILDMTHTYADAPDVDNLCYLYNRTLWRNDGHPHPWHDNTDDTDITATLDNVADDGRLTLRLTDNTHRTYLFKQVTATL